MVYPEEGSGFEKGVSQPLRWLCGGSRDCTGRGVTALGASRRAGGTSREGGPGTEGGAGRKRGSC